MTSYSFDDSASNSGSFPPANCIDGNPNTKCESQTNGTTLTLETKQKEDIIGVKITINEENKDSLIGAVVKIDNKTCGTISSISVDSSSSFTFSCENGAIFGETVTITTAEDKPLSLNEISIITEGKIFF